MSTVELLVCTSFDTGEGLAFARVGEAFDVGVGVAAGDEACACGWGVAAVGTRVGAAVGAGVGAAVGTGVGAAVGVVPHGGGLQSLQGR